MLLGKSADREIPWAQLFIEAALVVFSVLLALGVKSCRDAQVQEELANDALRNLKFEIEANKKEIQEVVSVHKEQLDTLRSEEPPRGINLRYASIQNNAWEAAQSTGAISHIDFSIVKIASKIEETQGQYQSFVVTSLNVAISTTFSADSTNIKQGTNALRLIVQGLAQTESQLLGYYETALKRMKEAGISVKDDSTKTGKPEPESVDTLSN